MLILYFGIIFDYGIFCNQFDIYFELQNLKMISNSINDLNHKFLQKYKFGLHLIVVACVINTTWVSWFPTQPGCSWLSGWTWRSSRSSRSWWTIDLPLQSIVALIRTVDGISHFCSGKTRTRDQKKKKKKGSEF